MLFKSRDAEINKNQEYSNFLYAYFDSDHSIDIAYRLPFTSTVHLFNSYLIYCCARKQSETSRSISNAETRSMYTGVLNKNWIRKFFRSIVYPIVHQ